MVANVSMCDQKTKSSAIITGDGQLVVAPLDFSTPVALSLTSTGTAFNFIEPSQGKKIVITDIIASADNSVSNTSPADIEIYEAEGPETASVFKSIVRPQLTRGQSMVLTGLNMMVPGGLWVNAKTSDNNVLVTIMFYRANE